MVSIPEIENPVDRYLAYIEERDAIYQRKSRGDPWPWTEDDILRSYRFTEIYRERDRTSLHYQKLVRDRYGDDPIVLPATVLYRWFNRIETCEALFVPSVNQSVFEHYIETNMFSVLEDLIHSLPPPHVTGAFIITGKPGYSKAQGVLEYFKEWMKKPWQKKWRVWQALIPTLAEMDAWLDSDGLGSFLRAQLVADLKYVPFLRNAEDWWTWAAPGPGSMRGLNIVLGRDMNTSWNKKEWLTEIQKLRMLEDEHFSFQSFHAQDTQNHCCEFSKYTKVMIGEGRPRQVYHHA